MDGQEAGATPLEIDEATVGDHELVATLAGHRPARAQVRMQPGERLELELRPEPEPARLRVQTEVEHGWVEVGGVASCRAPCEVEVPAGRKHTLRLRAPGYLPAEQVVEPKPGGVDEIALELEEDPLAAARRGSQLWGTVLAATGAVLVVGGLVAVARGLGTARDAETAYARYEGAGTGAAAGRAWDEALSLDDQAELETGLGVGLVGAGLGAGLVGAHFWVSVPGPEEVAAPGQ